MSTSGRSRKVTAQRRAAKPTRKRGAGRPRKASKKVRSRAATGKVAHRRVTRSRASPAKGRTIGRSIGRTLPRFTTLRLGARGPVVERLQQALTGRGFNCGAIDGDFSQSTEAAVTAFQRSEGLLPDGVAGPRTLTALGLMTDDSLPSATGELTVSVAAVMCPGAPLSNIKTYLPAVVRAMKEADLVDRSMLLMAIATICAETGRFAPLDEFRSRFNTSPNAGPPYFDLYDQRGDLGNRGPHDGASFKGRGFVQLTGRANYRQIGRALGLDDQLERNPERANEPLIAARVLARFLKDRELRIKNALLERDFAAARRAVNGGRHGLDEFTRSFLAGERLIT